jgi:hypothetical protein
MFVCSISVGATRRHHQNIAGADGMAASFDFTPALPLDTVNQDRLVNAQGALDKVSCGFRKISDIRWEQAFEQVVSESRSHHVARQNDNPLPGEPFGAVRFAHKKLFGKAMLGFFVFHYDI